MERLLTALAAAFIICLMVGPFVIPLLRALKFGQNIRNDGPQAHLKKAGTPTMGGIIFLIGISGATLLTVERPISLEAAMLVLFMVGCSLIGFLDDFIKVVRKRSLGLRAYQKLLGQIFLAVSFAWVAVHFLKRGTDVQIPFTTLYFDLGWWYYPFAVVVVLAATNAVNFTDGLDGLASGCMFMSSLAYTAIAMLAVTQGLGVYTHDFDLGVFAMAVAGGCLGFLRYNHHPAKVFMGDTGSIALGGALASLAILTRTELLLILLGGLYAVEVLSVVIQVISFQTTGKRVFKMAPIHHHFELIGWSEKRVVYTFWAISLALGALSVFAYASTLG
ncbi:MAG TPA: phospho-N-acetylmuramoyl-pentapeptide-transferase [Verrucomicrobiae bacterium]|nr:phospho-N-acetylmuramoyl-pentapeptide-transferase [Verrucomicrobiae bacterium]